MALIYFDPTYTGGGSNGSFAAPYLSFSSTPTFAGGNSYLLKRGTTFTGTINPGVATGTAANPIYIGVYDPITGLPVTKTKSAAFVNATGVSYGVFITSNVGYITVEGLEIYGANLRCIAKATVSSSPSEASYCNFLYLVTRNCLSIGMVIQGKGNKILNCSIWDCSNDNVQCNADDIEIAYCDFRRPNFFDADSDGDNLQITTGQRYNVHHNFFDNRVNDYKQCFIDQTSGATDPSIFSDNYCLADPVASGVGIVYLAIIYAPGSIVQRNKFVGGFNALQLQGVGSIASSNFVDNRGAGSSGGTSGIQLRNDNIQVYNNTVIGDSTNATSVGISHAFSTDTGCSIKNNILIGWPTGIITIGGVVSVVKNAYLGCTLNAAGTNTTPIALISSDIDSDYKPLTSALIKAGTPTPYTLDYSGYAFWNLPTIGCYEALGSRLVRDPPLPAFRGAFVAYGRGDKNRAGTPVNAWSSVVPTMSAYGFNAIFPAVVGAMGADYPSTVVRRRAGGATDYIQQVITAAAPLGMQVHVWVKCWVSSGQDDGDAANSVATHRAANQLNLETINGTTIQEDTFTMLSPAVLSARAIMTNLVLEIVNNYNIDGIMLDYCRFAGGTNVGSYNPESRAWFESWSGSPVAVWPQDCADGGIRAASFKAFNTYLITSWVEEVRAAMKLAKPNVKLGACPLMTKISSDERDQDWYDWMRRGLIDFAIPQTYTKVQLVPFADLVNEALASTNGITKTLYPFVYTTTLADGSAAEVGGVNVERQYVKASSFPGWAEFDWKSSYPTEFPLIK